jgi:hypothetical protein
MKDLQTTIEENDAYYQGAQAYHEGKPRNCPLAPYLGRQRELWFRAYDKAAENFPR